MKNLKQLLCVTLAALGLTVSVGAQTDDDSAAPDEDPTKVVVFNVRFEHRELLNGASAQIMTLRRDVALPIARDQRPNHKILLLRADLPLMRLDAGGSTESGLSDLYIQALHVHPYSRRFALAFGSGLFLPTASEDPLGTGKWSLAPVVVPVWFLKEIKGLAYVKFQDAFSVAGDEERPEIHILAVTPTFLKYLGRRNFMLVDSESRTNWREDAQTSFRSGLLLGRALNRRSGFWAKLEVPWGEHRTGDWTLKTSLALRGRR